MADRVPSYAELPQAPGTAQRHAWHVWPGAPVVGTPNRIDRAAIARGVAAVAAHEHFSLAVPESLIDPPLFGRPRARHRLERVSPTAVDDVIDDYNTQAGSQWDGPGHVRHPAAGFFGGGGEAPHGVGAWARRGIVGRAVLADVAARRDAGGGGRGSGAGFSDLATVSLDELREALAAQGSALAPGDLLFVRTGWLAHYRGLGAAERGRYAVVDPVCLGLERSEALASWLWDSGIAALGTDCPAAEAWPPGPDRAESLHARLVPLLGMPLGELLDLDAWAAACAGDGRYEALVTIAPIPLDRGAATPANTIVVR